MKWAHYRAVLFNVFGIRDSLTDYKRNIQMIYFTLDSREKLKYLPKGDKSNLDNSGPWIRKFKSMY